MENKYYTPRIEELRDVRTPYEYRYNYKNSSKEWLEIEDEDYNDRLLSDHIEVRVKYLDRSDIESLGFKHTTEINQEFEDSEDYVMGDWELSTWNELKRQAVSVEKKSKFGKNTVHFAGCIKNKSELKRLLKQLGI